MKVLVVGAGLTGSVVARELSNNGHYVKVIDMREHAGGNCYTQTFGDYEVHKYGPHIFHTDDEEVMSYVLKHTTMRPFINTPLASVGDRLYNLPFNMHTFYQLWGSRTPEEAKKALQETISSLPFDKDPENLEQEALLKVGRDIYRLFIKGYSEKFWGKPCDQLPVGLIGRLPLRFTFDNNYFTSKYQGILDYRSLFNSLLEDIDVELNTPFTTPMISDYDLIVHTGRIDVFFGMIEGELEFISVEFQESEEKGDVQGVAVINYPDEDVPYTRSTEHKHFVGSKCKKSIITKEIPNSSRGIACYPVPTKNNEFLYKAYEAKVPSKVRFLGRLGSYRYLNMDQAIKEALKFSRSLVWR